MRISIIGTGAIGGYYGIMLANAGHEVHFLLHSDFDYVSANGLLLKSEIHHNVSLPKINAYKHAADMPTSDIILVALKTTQNKTVLPKLLSQLKTDQSVVILIQNGVGMEETLSKQLPHLYIGGGVALIASHKAKNGTIFHQDYGNLDLGNYNIKDTSLLIEFSSQLIAAGVPSSVQDLKYLRWKKLVWNATFNGLSVALDMTTDQILADAQSLKKCRIIMDEVIRAARACEVQIPTDFDEEMIAFTQKMRPYAPSMKLDYDNKRSLELEYMYKIPIKTAHEMGFNMTETQKLYDELKILDLNNSL